MNIIKQTKQTLSRLRSLTSDSDKVLFDCGDFEITKRELIGGVIILAGMILVGIGISNGITDALENNRREYTQALKVTSQDMFEYGMATNVGNAFVYGTLEAADTVGFDEIPGTYLYVEKTREEYTRHTREVEHTDSDGKKYYTTETYYSWDYDSRQEKHANFITFLGVRFEYKKITRPMDHYIDTIYEDSDTRYVYYGTAPSHTGTIYCKLMDNTIPDHTTFHENVTIEQLLESFLDSPAVAIFWIGWTVLTGVLIYGFFYMQNDWLE